MKVRLVSKDPALYSVCREVLHSLQDCRWDFGRVDGWQSALDADLWIWDCDSEEPFPPESWLREEHNIIFVVERQKIVLFRDLLPVEAVRIVLKPVRPNLLRGFLEQILVPSTRTDATQETRRIKSDRDLLLRHVLEANLWLQEYEQDRNGFLARTAHDLRAPLVAISGYCGLLLDRRLGPLNPEQLSALEKMYRSGNRMTWLTDGMLQLSVGSEISRDLTMKFGDMREMIQQAMAEIRPVADSKQLKLQADITPPPEPLLFEPRQIEQVLVNLLDNACRLAPRGGIVNVKAFPTFWNWRSANVSEAPSKEERRSIELQKPNAYWVEIRDSGPAVGAGPAKPTSGQPPSVAQNGSAHGLGVSICRHMISAHKGKLFTDSGPRGPAFSFVLPFIQKKVSRAYPLRAKFETA